MPTSKASPPLPIRRLQPGSDANSARHPARPNQETTGQTNRLALGSISASQSTMEYHVRVKTLATASTGRKSRKNASGDDNAANNGNGDSAAGLLDFRGHDGHAHETIPTPKENRRSRQNIKDSGAQHRRQVRRLNFRCGEADENSQQCQLDNKCSD